MSSMQHKMLLCTFTHKLSACWKHKNSEGDVKAQGDGETQGGCSRHRVGWRSGDCVAAAPGRNMEQGRSHVFFCLMTKTVLYNWYQIELPLDTPATRKKTYNMTTRNRFDQSPTHNTLYNWGGIKVPKWGMRTWYQIAGTDEWVDPPPSPQQGYIVSSTMCFTLLSSVLCRKLSLWLWANNCD